MARPVAPQWLKNYAKLEGAKLVLSYPGPRVGYNRPSSRETGAHQWFLCKCNSYQADHDKCNEP